MFNTICTPVDNSEFSDAAIDFSIDIARRFKSELVGCHVYAAKLHDYRFKQMEFTLPDEYHEEKELEKQRKIHDSLITMGLQLISDSYLEVMKQRADEDSIPFTPKMFDGKNWKVLVKDIQESSYDLVIMGALGLGAVKESVVGSVTERVIRRVKSDVLVMKDARPFGELDGPIVVGIDGSPESFAALQTAIGFAKEYSRPLEAVAVYDPYLHYAMFNSLAGVLTEKASKVFKFKEQEQLHEEVIDTGLAKIYQSHLEVAARVASDQGIELKTTLMDGKAFEKMIRYVRMENPSILFLGRIGVHSEEDMDIGSNAENLLRLAPCNVYICSRRWVPPTDVRAEESVVWTPEALERLEMAPSLIRGIAKTAIHRYAMERGYSIVSESVVDQAINTILPPHLAQRIGVLAEEVAIEKGDLRKKETYICSDCGYAARNTKPVVCPVCSTDGTNFEKIDYETLEKLALLEGNFKEEKTFDGFNIRWTDESREVLRKVPSGYERRRMKARVQKFAKVRRQETITRELVEEICREANYEFDAVEKGTNGSKTNGNGAIGQSAAEITSEFDWKEDASQRLYRVPEGFMRDMTQSRIEALAKEREESTITLELVEEGIKFGRQMAESSAGYTESPQPNTIEKTSWSSKTDPLNEVGGEELKKIWG